MFMPAPRPRLTEEEARQLIEDSADLGFGRTTGSAKPEVATPIAKPAPLTPVKPRRAPAPKPARTTGQTLRFDVPDALWTALKLESVHRRVTVKYLMLEALAKAGYPVDIDAMPEDGRRIR